MRRLAPLSLLAVAACATAAPHSPAAAPAAAPLPASTQALPRGLVYPAHDTLHVVTWNVEHFVDAHDDPYVSTGREDRPPADMAERRALLGRALRALDADVVVLQEFESVAFAEALARELVPELGYRFAAGAPSPTWYQNVVVLSRLPLGVLRAYGNVVTPVEEWHDSLGRAETQSLVNNRMWTVELRARPGYAVQLTGLHLKAGRSPRDVGHRLGQVRFLRGELARLQRLEPDANLLVVGDLNATPDSRELRLFRGEPCTERRECDGAGEPLLVDPLPPATLTHPSDAPTRRIDHVLVGRAMLPELVPGSGSVARPLADAELRRISDHLPVTVTFLTRDR